MALHWGSCGLLYMVSWIILILFSGVDNSLFTSSGRRDTRTILHHRLRRAADEEAILLSNSKGKLSVDKQQQEVSNSDTSRSIVSKEDRQSPDYEEQKLKHKYKQTKYLGNDNKTLSSIKTKFGSSLFSPNESFNDKLKPSLYNVSKYNSTNKKDEKTNVDSTELSMEANYSKPLVLNENNFDKPEAQFYVEPINRKLNVTKINVDETQEMSDQPVAGDNEFSLNNTEFIDDESVLQNSSIHNSSQNSTSADSRIMPSLESFDIILICSIILATVLLAGLIGGSGYVVYRRRIWNKPQTLSDKCSNADSSGYIDDSTLRENSEEMYSLDNDSFLNSLEAMTIQNYWTDNVKHTKL